MRDSDRRLARNRILDVLRSVKWRWRARIALRGLVWVGALTAGVMFLSAIGLERMRFDAEAVLWFRILTWGTFLGSTFFFLVRPLLVKVTRRAGGALSRGERALARARRGERAGARQRVGLARARSAGRGGRARQGEEGRVRTSCRAERAVPLRGRAQRRRRRRDRDHVARADAPAVRIERPALPDDRRRSRQSV